MASLDSKHNPKAASTPQSKHPDNKQIVHRLAEECWNEGKMNAIGEICADNIRLHDPVFPHLTAGASNLRQHIETCRKAFPDLKITNEDTIAERNEVVTHWTIRGTHKGDFLGMHPTHRKASVTGSSIYRLENGRIVEQWSHWNLMSLLEQLGVATQHQPNAAQQTSTAHSQHA